MVDKFERNIGYVRISVTDRCNLRCSYCMPPQGVVLKHHHNILSFDEIIAFVEAVIPLGISKVRLTGGEPLVRQGIVELVRGIANTSGVTDLAMTTNGILLSKYAIGLKEAGLHRLNISLDTLDVIKFNDVTRGGNLNDVLNGIDAARKAGFDRIKINSVLFDGASPNEKVALAAFCHSEGLELRFIHQMDLATGAFSIVDGGQGGNCSVCNRIRLTADGVVKPCLFSDIEYSIRELGVINAVKLAVQNKPQCGTQNSLNHFYAIGG